MGKFSTLNLFPVLDDLKWEETEEAHQIEGAGMFLSLI